MYILIILLQSLISYITIEENKFAIHKQKEKNIIPKKVCCINTGLSKKKKMKKNISKSKKKLCDKMAMWIHLIDLTIKTHLQ